MNNKLKNKASNTREGYTNHKFTTILLIILLIPISIIKIGDVFFSKEDKEPVIDKSITYEVESFEELKETFYDGSISVSQMQESLNDYLDYYPTFETEVESGDINEKNIDSVEDEKSLDSDKVHDLMTAYLDGLFIEQNRLSKLLPLVKEKLEKVENLTGEKLKNDIQVVNNLKTPIVDGLMREMHTTPLYINSEESEYSVWVGYGEIKELYKDYLSEFHMDLIKLHSDVIRFGYTRMDGEIDATVIYNRLLLIDEIQNGDVTKDDYFWENERYQLAVLFTGYGEDELPVWDKARLKQMTDISEASPESDSYRSVAKELSESIREEGKYGEETSRIANRWMHEEFQEYSKYIEQLNKDSEQ